MENVFHLLHHTICHAAPDMTKTIQKLIAWIKQKNPHTKKEGQSALYLIPDQIAVGMALIQEQKLVSKEDAGAFELDINDFIDWPHSTKSCHQLILHVQVLFARRFRFWNVLQTESIWSYRCVKRGLWGALRAHTYVKVTPICSAFSSCSLLSVATSCISSGFYLRGWHLYSRVQLVYFNWGSKNC